MAPTLATSSDVILTQLAEQGRRVLSAWRALILLRRATLTMPQSQRRWTLLPHDVMDVLPLLRQMERRGKLGALPQLRYVFEVDVPYARRISTEEEEVLFEINPYAVISHRSALAFHGLSYQLPKGISLVYPADGSGGLIPLDTDASDWDGIPLVRGIRPPRILGRAVTWTRIPVERFFGFREYRLREYPIRVTTPERTLLDGLIDPSLCGGLEDVLQAWMNARSTLDTDALVHLAERFGIAVLRQRVGFVLDRLGVKHPRIDEWQLHAKRGGSSKLLGSAPYASIYDERWSLSLNAPLGVLDDDLT